MERGAAAEQGSVSLPPPVPKASISLYAVSVVAQVLAVFEEGAKHYTFGLRDNLVRPLIIPLYRRKPETGTLNN